MWHMPINSSIFVHNENWVKTLISLAKLKLGRIESTYVSQVKKHVIYF